MPSSALKWFLTIYFCCSSSTNLTKSITIWEEVPYSRYRCM